MSSRWQHPVAGHARQWLLLHLGAGGEPRPAGSGRTKGGGGAAEEGAQEVPGDDQQDAGAGETDEGQVRVGPLMEPWGGGGVSHVDFK